MAETALLKAGFQHKISCFRLLFHFIPLTTLSKELAESTLPTSSYVHTALVLLCLVRFLSPGKSAKFFGEGSFQVKRYKPSSSSELHVGI